jgi:hypothetical protein
VCNGGCAGIWFDNYELDKVDERHEAAGEALLRIPRHPAAVVDYSLLRTCPRCDNVRMLKHFFSVKREVEIDECPGCGGIWLDAGELRQIREQFESEEERRGAAEQLFGEVFADQLKEQSSRSQEELQRARKLSRLFRFICPSYYLPGDQAWGAF